jgi:hypothetical protein
MTGTCNCLWLHCYMAVFTKRTNVFFSLWIKLHALIWLGVSVARYFGRFFHKLIWVTLSRSFIGLLAQLMMKESRNGFTCKMGHAGFLRVVQGCQIFLDTLYQNGDNVTNSHYKCLTAIHTIKQMATKQNIPKRGGWVGLKKIHFPTSCPNKQYVFCVSWGWFALMRTTYIITRRYLHKH